MEVKDLSVELVVKNADEFNKLIEEAKQKTAELEDIIFRLKTFRFVATPKEK